MADRHDEDEEPTILDIAYQPIIAHSVAPQARELTSERFPARSRIVSAGDPFAQKGRDPLGSGAIEFG